MLTDLPKWWQKCHDIPSAFSLPKIFSPSRQSRPVQAEGDGNVLMAKVALAATRAASLLPSIPVQELQLPWQQSRCDCGLALWRGSPGDPACRGVFQTSILKKAVWRETRASTQTEGPHGAACPLVDPGGAPRILLPVFNFCSFVLNRNRETEFWVK